MISAEFIVNTGQYQHVALTVSGDDVDCFSRELAAFDDALKAKLGEFQAELESWTWGVYDKLTSGDIDAAEKLLKEALGATRVEVYTLAAEPAHTAPENKFKPTTAAITPPWEKSGDDW